MKSKKKRLENIIDYEVCFNPSKISVVFHSSSNLF